MKTGGREVVVGIHLSAAIFLEVERRSGLIDSLEVTVSPVL